LNELMLSEIDARELLQDCSRASRRNEIKGTPALMLGGVYAPDEQTAIERAIEEFKSAPGRGHDSAIETRIAKLESCRPRGLAAMSDQEMRDRARDVTAILGGPSLIRSEISKIAPHLLETFDWMVAEWAADDERRALN
jgi:hypothetical protein